MREPTALYNAPVQMEPLVIDSSRPLYEPLIGLAYELAELSSRIDAKVHPSTARGLADLVAGMNCYYSNLIEGQHTLPLDIDRALRELVKPEQKDLKSLAVAHVATERWARSRSIGKDSLLPFVLEAHFRFCSALPEDMLRIEDGTKLTPGEIRRRDVQVGYHVAPAWQSLDAFLDRFVSFYGTRLESAGKGGTSKLAAIVAAFCAHHRFVWIHPFLDGNGRIARILLDAMLRACGINGASLWSMSRGFAKTQAAYKAALAEADRSRMGDLDGRGTLSEKRLHDFCDYAIRTAIDQARFMEGILDLDRIAQRSEAYFTRVRFDIKGREAHELFMRAFVHGEIERGEAARITGLSERSARTLLGTLLDEGFLESDTPKGKVRAGFPLHALGSLLPNLYPAGDLDVDVEQLKAERRSRRLSNPRES
ncbi:MAG: Fic family protein [Dechloromonas sp.]|nr:Fic family protein [Dechloromonas sp.]